MDDGVKVPDIDELSNEDDPVHKNKQMEVVDEAYENMNAFDMKLKSLKLVKWSALILNYDSYLL